jgi:predicted histone-like DNA-binding protein
LYKYKRFFINNLKISIFMKYKIIARANPRDPQQPKKYYAEAVNEGRTSEDALSKEIAGRSSLTAGDVSNVIHNLLDEVPKFLLMGRSVSLGSLGSFHLTIHSDSADSAEAFKVDLIKGVHVIFTPSVDFKRMLETVHFERSHEQEGTTES